MNGHDSIILAAGSNVVTSALDLFSQFAIIGGGLWAVYAARDLHKDGAVITAKGDKLAGSGFDSEKFGGDLFTLDYKDGTAVIGRPTMGIRITGASGSCSVSYFNKTRTTAGAYLLDRNYDEATHFAAKGSYIVLEREDSTQVKAGGSVRLKVVSKGTGSSSFAIGENQMVLTKSDGANVPSWVDFPVGEEVTLSITAADPAWGEVEYAVGGKLLIDDGTVTTSGIDAARSEIRTSVSGPAFSSARIHVIILVVLAIAIGSVSRFPKSTRPVSPSIRHAAVANS